MEKAVKIMQTPDKFMIPPGVGVESVTTCRSTGYRATKSCPVANIIIASGQAPDTYCPMHGGDVTLAQGDFNAPILLLTPDDSELRSQYQLALLRPEETNDDFIVYEPTIIDVPPPPLPAPTYEETYVDPSPADEVESRYQELLRQYNLM
jgi:penicillin-binding protein 1A